MEKLVLLGNVLTGNKFGDIKLCTCITEPAGINLGNLHITYMDNQRLPNSDPKIIYALILSFLAHTHGLQFPNQNPGPIKWRSAKLFTGSFQGLERGRRGGAPHRPRVGGLCSRRGRGRRVVLRQIGLVEDARKEGTPWLELRLRVEDGSQSPPWPASSPACSGSRALGHASDAGFRDRRISAGRAPANGLPRRRGWRPAPLSLSREMGGVAVVLSPQLGN
jgi:hypothetical protein